MCSLVKRLIRIFGLLTLFQTEKDIVAALDELKEVKAITPQKYDVLRESLNEQEFFNRHELFEICDQLKVFCFGSLEFFVQFVELMGFATEDVGTVSFRMVVP